jgi:DNA-binding transcriptional LysR family regulator
MMDLEGLNAFLAVMEHGSLLGAAEALGASRTTLRRRIETLEESLNLVLFVRGRQGAVATPAGEALAREVRPVLRQLETIAGTVQAGSEELHGELCIMVPHGLPVEAVLACHTIVAERYPHLEVRLEVGEHLDLVPAVDLLIHFGPTPPRGQLITTVLARMPERLLASPAYLAANGTPTTVEALNTHRLLSWRPPGEDGKNLPLLDEQGRPAGVERIRPVLVSPDIHLIRHVAAGGGGIALLPDHPFPPGIVPGDLVHVLPDKVGRDCALRMVVAEAHAAMPRTRKATRLIRELVELFSQ